MADGACALLRRAREVYDSPTCPLAFLAGEAWQAGFASGGRWMQQALVHLRREDPAGVGVPALAGLLFSGDREDRLKPGLQHLNALGIVKYGLAGGAALLVIAATLLLGCWPLCVLSVPAFYAVEAQMVFLFPLVLDRYDNPFREARRWTVRAGGTLAVMRIVLPLAAVMLLGGFARQGFVRSWCLGCLAVCVWYEDLRTADA
jgi:hypothetical protein